MKTLIKAFLILLSLSILPLQVPQAAVSTTGSHHCYFRNGFQHGVCHKTGVMKTKAGKVAYYHKTMIRHGMPVHRTSVYKPIPK